MTRFGERLRILRTTRHWSQERLGFELGVSKATISKWENGQSEPNFVQLLAIKAVFSAQAVTLDYLVDARVSHQLATHMEAPDIADVAAALRNAKFPQEFSDDEFALLACYRRLNQRQQRSLLGLIGD